MYVGQTYIVRSLLGFSPLFFCVRNQKLFLSCPDFYRAGATCSCFRSLSLFSRPLCIVCVSAWFAKLDRSFVVVVQHNPENRWVDFLSVASFTLGFFICCLHVGCVSGGFRSALQWKWTKKKKKSRRWIKNRMYRCRMGEAQNNEGEGV